MDTELDPEALRKLADIVGSDGVAELIEVFSGDLPIRLAELRNGSRTNDLDLVARAAHSLKSGVAYMGSASLSDLCGTMEEAARSLNLEAVQQLMPDLERRLNRANEELRSLASMYKNS